MSMSRSQLPLALSVVRRWSFAEAQDALTALDRSCLSVGTFAAQQGIDRNIDRNPSTKGVLRPEEARRQRPQRGAASNPGQGSRPGQPQDERASGEAA